MADMAKLMNAGPRSIRRISTSIRSAMLKKIPSLAGMSPWVLMDFHSPRRLLPGTQDYFNRKGLFSIQGEHKQAFYVLQKYYREMDSTK